MPVLFWVLLAFGAGWVVRGKAGARAPVGNVEPDDRAGEPEQAEL